jgi:hypothetical protein
VREKQRWGHEVVGEEIVAFWLKPTGTAMTNPIGRFWQEQLYNISSLKNQPIGFGRGFQ